MTTTAVAPALGDTLAAALAGHQDNAAKAIGYWKDGTQIIEQKLAVAAQGNWNDAPAGLSLVEARLWHRAQAEAYRHALEMMGYTPGAGA